MIHYQDDIRSFSASSIVASFGDGVEVSLDNVTFIASTPMGDEWILSTNDDGDYRDTTVSRVVRLITISPEKDWRMNASYAWKLDNAWMSDEDYSWLHWNSNSYVDSVVRVPGDSEHPNSQIFTCNVMEFHFDAILPSGFRRSSDPIVTNTRVVLKNVQWGSNLVTLDKDKLQHYSPCSGPRDGNKDPICIIMDGVVSGESSWRIPSPPSSTLNNLLVWQLLLLLGVVLGIIILCAYLVWKLIRCCFHWQRTKRYQEINPSQGEGDLTLYENCEEESDK
ncbi:hypothetical protein IV203_002943 [Nitzschia inconspicua]|uniref:Uncharacterized protein n=1 Tax=Nitzschia inconspicua TaxID=303405 RepID=A0A9K3L103_9STRA|nr:hypothetical protein IV203_002943 [Nitzschia inconspicua]